MSEFKFGDKVLYLDEVWLVVAFDQKNNIVDLIRKGDLSIRGVSIPRGENGIVTLISRHQEWVLVKDETPEPDTTVLACWAGNDDIEPELDYITYHPSYGEMWANNNEYTHWMPLPEPPKELL